MKRFVSSLSLLLTIAVFASSSSSTASVAGAAAASSPSSSSTAPTTKTEKDPENGGSDDDTCEEKTSPSSSSASSTMEEKDSKRFAGSDSLRDFLQTTVFGQNENQNQNQNQNDDSETIQNDEKPQEAWPKPFLSSLFSKTENKNDDNENETETESETENETENKNNETDTDTNLDLELDPNANANAGTDENSETIQNPFFSSFDGIQQARSLFTQGNDGHPSVEEGDSTSRNEKILAKVFEKARLLAQKEDTIDLREFFSKTKAALKQVSKQFQENFGDLLNTHIESYIALAMPYFAMREDSRNSPLEKRRLHRFYQKVTKDELIDLHGALYLSHLAYVNTIEQFEKGLEAFENNSWKRLYGTTESLPDLPAHFLLIHKELDPLDSKSGSGTSISSTKKKKNKELPLAKTVRETLRKLYKQEQKQSEVLVAIVVRGTKQASDLLADGILEPVPYRGGFAHGGILKAGKNLAEHYLPKLKDLHDITNRDKIRVVLIGHSLGAGAASIAAMELKEHDFLEVEALGFGCPSLLSKDLSESTKEYITTVVNDADVVSRLSGASVTNILLDLMDYDWTGDFLEDMRFSLERAKESFPKLVKLFPDTEGTVEWFTQRLDEVIRPKMQFRKNKGSPDAIPQRLPNVLIPPGRCIHLFRDGYGMTATYTPCDFFSRVELSLTLLDDHMIPTGYNRAMLAVAQDSDRDYSFQFANDVNGIVGV